MKIRLNQHSRRLAFTIIIIAVLAVSVALVVIAKRYLPEKVKLNQSIAVAAPPSYLFEEINDLERWPVWSYWFDDGAQVTYNERKTGIDASCSWNSGDDVRKVTILQERHEEMVRARLDFPVSESATYEFQLRADSLDPAQTHLEVFVELSGEENGVWARLKRLLLAARFGGVFDHTLEGLRRIAETKPTFSYGISEELLAPSYYISIEVPSRPELPTSSEIINAQKTLRNVLKRAGVRADGYPFSMASDSPGVRLCCIPVPPDANLPASYPILQLYSGAAIRAIDTVGYEDVKAAHDEVRRYIRYKEYVLNGEPWEVYEADSDHMYDPSDWITQVYYPVLKQPE